ncbi:MAG TPA: DUF6585 family protein [Ktedonobacteraceae bacterium]|nr:DUF6585 family protein [Ktedonobacteraceae bacterium]
MRLSAKQVPLEIEQYALAHQLGMPRIVYNSREESFLSLFLGPFTLLTGSSSIALYYALYDTIFSWWPAWQGTLIPLVGVMWLGVGVWIICSPFFQAKLRVFLCPSGLIYAKQTFKQRMEAILWNEIEQIWKDISIDKQDRRIVHAYSLIRNDGSSFVFTPDLLQLERLGAFLEREVTRRLLPGAIIAYDAGKTVDFETLTVSSAGITLRRERKQDRLLPWSSITHIAIGEATVNIYHQDNTRGKTKLKTLPTSRLANVCILKGLVEYIRREQERNQLPQVIAYKAGFEVFFGS